MDVMKSNYQSAQRFIVKAIPDLVKNPVSFEPENKYAVMTDQKLLNDRHKEILEVVLN